MKKASPAWKWFGVGCLLSLVLSVVATIALVGDKLNQAGSDPALAAPPLAVAVSVLMTFFALLIPGVALCGAVIVIIDGYSRRTR